MAEIQPILLTIEPFDALKGTSVYFTYTGSKQALDNELVITDVGTKEIVYDYEYSSFEKVHHIPPTTLQNGKTYTAKIRIKASDGTYSPYSNSVQFVTLATPVLDITNIDGQGYVYNTNVTFVAKYTQENGENIKNYRFSLYNENEDLIKDFPVRYPDNDNNELTETVDGLEKGKAYFIECLIETVNGFTWSTRERFIPLYIVPSINGVISTRNDADNGFVRITANLKKIIGTRVAGDSVSQAGSLTKQESSLYEDDAQKVDGYEYIDEDWVIVPDNNPILFTGLDMNRASDFVMKVWCRNIPNGKEFIDISPPYDNGIAIQLWKYSDRVLAVKELNGIKSVYCSNIVTIPNGVDFMIYMKVIEHRIDLEIKLLR